MFKLSENQLQSRIVRGVSANGLNQVITVAINVIGLPIFLQSWGTGLYGEWLILSAIPTYLSISDIGFATVASNDMTMSVAQGNKLEALKTFQSIWILISSISIFIIAVMAVVFFVLPIETFVKLQYLSPSEAKIIIFVLSLYTLTGMQASLIMAGFRCDGNYALGTIYFSILRFLEFIVLITAVYFHTSPIIAVISSFIASVLGTFMTKVILSKKSAWLTYGCQHASLGLITSLYKPAIASMGFPMANAISNQGITIVIGSITGPSNLVLFSALRTLSRFVLQLTGIIKNTISPEISSAYASQNFDLARSLHRHACKTSFWISLTASIGLIFKGKVIITTWTKGIIALDSNLFLLMLLTIIIGSFWYTSITILSSTNRHYLASIWYLLTTSISIFSSLFFVPVLGLFGGVLSMLLIDVFMSVYVVRKSICLLDDDMLDYFKFILKPPFPCFLKYNLK